MKSSGLVLATFVLSACHPKAESHDVEIAISNAVAFVCSNECRAVSLDLRIYNKSDTLYCVADHYLGANASEEIEITARRDGSRFRQVAPLGVPPPLEFKGIVENSRKHGLHLIIQAHSDVTKHIQTGEVFEIPKQPAKLALRVLVYPCADAEFKRFGWSMLATESGLNYE